MNIVIMTNTYKPIVGGLEKSIEIFSEEFRKRGHRVLIVAPEFKGFPCCKEKNIFRLPAIQNFNGTDFSVELPVPTGLSAVLKRFDPDIIHSQHPFLVGDTALRVSASLNKPLVFTYHTFYGDESSYFLAGSKLLTSFANRLSVGYANLCDIIIAPSNSIADFLRKQGVKKRIEVIPTGIRKEEFEKGSSGIFRGYFGIPEDAFVFGTVSRIVQEKNIRFLSKVAAQFLKENKKAYFLFIGQGPLFKEIMSLFEKNKVAKRVIAPGILTGKKLVNAFAAMDTFVFASKSETQGIILAEAMAAGKPVIALSAPAVNEIVKDKKNGKIVRRQNISLFSQALYWMAKQSPQNLEYLSHCAKKTAEKYSIKTSVEKMLKIYRETAKLKRDGFNPEKSNWKKTVRMLKAQTSLVVNTARSTVSAIAGAGLGERRAKYAHQR